MCGRAGLPPAPPAAALSASRSARAHTAERPTLLSTNLTARTLASRGSSSAGNGTSRHAFSTSATVSQSQSCLPGTPPSSAAWNSVMYRCSRGSDDCAHRDRFDTPSHEMRDRFHKPRHDMCNPVGRAATRWRCHPGTAKQVSSSAQAAFARHTIKTATALKGEQPYGRVSHPSTKIHTRSRKSHTHAGHRDVTAGDRGVGLSVPISPPRSLPLAVAAAAPTACPRARRPPGRSRRRA